MAGLFTLLMLSTVMAAASFLAGMLPLSLKLSQDKLRLISTIGMGVLVGTSLIVIIPEGVDTIYTAGNAAQVHRRSDQSLQMHANQVRWMHTSNDLLAARTFHLNKLGPREVGNIDPLAMPGPVIPENVGPPKTPTEPDVMGIMGVNDATNDNQDHADGKEDAHHAWIGVALIAGFILMFLIDKLPKSTSTTMPKPRTHHIALNNLGGRFNLTTNLDREEEAESFLENNQSQESRNRSSATTIGLVIHAAADGIALGASTSASHTRLSLVIFLAIMIHKAPAAFGLTSILLEQGLSKRMARAHLAIFSLAAPVGALLTWIVAHLLGSGLSDNVENTKWWTGILLLFSAGTFLYVAMHSMQEITDGPPPNQNMNGHATGGILEGRDSPQEQRRKPSLKDLAAAVFGMILPLFLQVGHAH